MVSLSALSSGKSYSTCTEPLPNVCRPITTARFRFFSAPATISEAEAEPEFTSTAIGSRSSLGSRRAFLSSRSLSEKPTVETIVQLGLKVAGGVPLEVLEADVADVAGEQLGLNRLDGDGGAGDGHHLGLVP